MIVKVNLNPLEDKDTLDLLHELTSGNNKLNFLALRRIIRTGTVAIRLGLLEKSLNGPHVRPEQGPIEAQLEQNQKNVDNDNVNFDNDNVNFDNVFDDVAIAAF